MLLKRIACALKLISRKVTVKRDVTRNMLHMDNKHFFIHRKEPGNQKQYIIRNNYIFKNYVLKEKRFQQKQWLY